MNRVAGSAGAIVRFRLQVREAHSALVLAADMVGAIVVSGIKEGEPISLTLAPALLVVMLLLLWPRPDVRSGPDSADRPGAYEANDPPGHGAPE